ncbi:hypothetical protein CCHL11_06879 [Colletotrichum chlorophyti]|uniref:Uncharacterized protein n=1 Tax=Colletotrichum chlorophyti TaxID=708187 RepID=A0A1Q8RBK1_9PEZI|nr:hypothetical protein CCHL11_06879 [Colletotrichum chlorophyti]
MSAKNEKTQRKPKVSEDAKKWLKALKGFQPQRLDLTWDVSDNQLTDEFFHQHLTNLISNVKLHIDVILKTGDLPKPASVWSIRPSPSNLELERCIDAVARPDLLDDNPWDDLIACDVKRMAVMRGVIMGVYERQVFSEHLFGADDKQLKALQDQDETFLQHDGFRRAHLRATTTKMLLAETHGVPPLFWEKVDKLATRVFRLILPVVIWATETRPEGSNDADIRQVFAAIHIDVAYAAWISVLVRLSPSILRFEWKRPGDRYLPDQLQIYPDILFNSQRGHWDRDAAAALTRSKNAFPPGSKVAGPPARNTRVMICVVPLIERLRLVGDDMGGEPFGFERIVLQDCRVIYYHGLEDDGKDREEFRKPLCHNQHHQRRRK